MSFSDAVSIKNIMLKSENKLGRKKIAVCILYEFLLACCPFSKGVVGWCEGAVYLTSLVLPTDIGLQLGKACYPCSG